MPRKPYSLLAPKPGKRRTWAVLIRTQARKRIQRSTGSPHEAAAREFALLYLRQHAPHLLNERPAKLAKL